MNTEQYRNAIDRTMNNGLTEKEKLSMLALGIAGEAGEIVDTIKKIVYHGHELNKEELIKELGDLVENIMKLNRRYKNGFSEEDSINREL